MLELLQKFVTELLRQVYRIVSKRRCGTQYAAVLQATAAKE